MSDGPGLGGPNIRLHKLLNRRDRDEALQLELAEEADDYRELDAQPYPQVLYDPEQIITLTANGKELLISLRGACREQIIPRTIDHARMDRWRYQGSYPEPAYYEGGRDYYWPDELEDWYWARPQLRDRTRRSRVRQRVIA